MFKKGQLVKTKRNGVGVIRRVSQKVKGRYLLSNPEWAFDMYFPEHEIVKLIGNNFKFKGGEVMEELFEELKHHRLEKVHFQVNRYEVVILDGVTIITASAGRMLHSLRSIRTASNHDARADDSEGCCRE